MCEIAVVPGSPAESNAASYVDLAQTLYEQNSHGLGMVAVYDETEGDDDAFNYGYYKTTDPTDSWPEIRDWFEQRSHAWRFVIHARLATAGGKTLEGVHPIKVTDDDVDSYYVVHNGVVSAHRLHRRNLEDDGHEFNTEVDSEVIAHTHADVPETLDDFDGTELRGRLNYLLFTDHGVLVRNTGKYTLSEDFTMSCRPVNNQTSASGQLPVGDDAVDGLGQCFALYKPDRSVETMDASYASLQSSGRYSTGNAAWTGSSRRGYVSTNRGWRSTSGSQTYADRTQDDDDDSDSEYNRSPRTRDEIEDDRGRYGGNRVYEDLDDETQIQINDASVEYARSVANDELKRHTSDEDDIVFVSLIESVIKDDHFTVTVCDGKDDPVVGARVFVQAPGSSFSYEHRGVYKTDETGAVMLPLPEGNTAIEARVITAPYDSIPTGTLPRGLIQPSDDDAPEPQYATLTQDEARQVDWWHAYGNVDAEYDGYCSMCYQEYYGLRCEDCLEKFSRNALLNKSQNEVFQDAADGDTTEPFASPDDTDDEQDLDALENALKTTTRPDPGE